MSLSILTIASSASASTNLSGTWSWTSCWVRNPRLLPIFTSAVSSPRRLASSAAVSSRTSRPNSRISARSLDFGTLMRSGLEVERSAATGVLAPASWDRVAAACTDTAGAGVRVFFAVMRILGSRPVGMAGKERNASEKIGRAGKDVGHRMRPDKGACGGAAAFKKPPHRGVRRRRYCRRSCGRMGSFLTNGPSGANSCNQRDPRPL